MSSPSAVDSLATTPRGVGAPAVGAARWARRWRWLSRVRDDGVLRLALVCYAAFVLLFHWPGVSVELLANVTWYLADPVFLGLALLSIATRDRSGESETGTRFWQLAGGAMLFWITASVVTFLLSLGTSDPRYHAIVDLLFIGYYLALIFAAEVRPDRRRRLPSVGLDERLNRVGAVTLCLVLLDYFVLIPSYLDPDDYSSLRPSLLLYLGLDLLLVGRFFHHARQTESRRWSWVYGLFATAFAVSACLGLLELYSLVPDSPIPWYSGTRWDLLWLLPMAPWIVAARVSRSWFAKSSGDSAWPAPGGSTTTTLAADGVGPVLLYALVPPILHLIGNRLGTTRVQSFEARETLVILYFLFAGSLAFLQYRGRERNRRQAFDELRDSEHRYRQLVESAPDGILVELAGRVVYSNPAARRMFGREALDPGPSLTELGLPEPSASLFLAQGSSETPSTVPREHLLCRATGEALWVEVSFLWILYRGKVACQVLLHDVTTLRRLGREARRMEQMATMGELAATIAHEIRNPLGALLFNLRILGKQLEDRASNRSKLDTVEGAAQRMQAVIKGILDYCRQEPPQVVQEPLETILQATIRRMDSRLAEAGVVLECSLGHRWSDVEVDVHQMVWVFGELISNALRETPPAGRIRIDTGHPTEDILEVRIGDSGPGIRAEDHDRVLRPFFTTHPERLGLGLARVARVLERHGVELEVVASSEHDLIREGAAETAEAVAKRPEPRIHLRFPRTEPAAGSIALSGVAG